ncbi:MAG: cyclic nucleotide-binding domain-containing protein [Alphaproteobacteria bacterium]|nr:cyclic nucleotide-binding domain-containing protein [Alphaproteobacteria bacterium]
MPQEILPTLDLLYDLQTERGLALIPPHQWHHIAPAQFQTQSRQTDAALARAQQNSPDFWTILPARFFEAFAQRVNDSFRRNQSVDSLMEWYRLNLEYPIHQMALSQLTGHASFTPSQTSALIHFIAALSYLAHVRDIGVNIYTKAEISLADNSRLKNAASAYLARERLYLGLADEPLKQLIDAGSLPSDVPIGTLHEIVRKIKNGYAKGVIASTPLPDWMALFNQEVQNLRAALARSIDKLSERGSDLAQQNETPQTLSSDIEQRLTQIGNLPLFRGLTEATLRSLLKGGKLVVAEKGDVLLTQGESVNRLYIVLDGWVKTVKMAANGQEAVLQILGKRDVILDTGFPNVPLSGLTAKAVTEANILSLSLATFRDHVSRNRELAQNLLAATSQRLQRLIGQFEQITLKTAAERVGWFLVNLHLETGLEGAPLTLPFDKALIASFLNIKPETLSRTLTEFKKQGFIIDKDKIILPGPHALCAFCDPEMAVRCCRAEAANCAPIRQVRRSEGK